MSDIDSRYSSALELYRSTDFPLRRICEQTDTPLTGFRAYLWRCQRQLMFARHGIEIDSDKAQKTRLRKPSGQSAETHRKYRDAILACDDSDHIELNISQIAREFNLDPTALGQQLRTHYPEILEHRNSIRERLGFAENKHRGARQQSIQLYADAVKHLSESDDTVQHTAKLFNVSFTGLRQHLLLYHRDLTENRAGRRSAAVGKKNHGDLTGNGKRYVPAKREAEKYAEAVALYASSKLPMREVAEKTGTTYGGLRNHLRHWHPDLLLKRRRK